MERANKIYHSSRNFMFKYILAFLWTSFNFFIFCKAFSNYHHDAQYFYLSRILGNGLCVSRGTAPVLNVTMALITLPTCKTFNSLLHAIFGRCSMRLLIHYLEKTKVLHLLLGFSLLIVALIHSVAHFVNIINFVGNYDERYREINWANGPDDSVARLLFTTPTGFSGCIMLLTLFAIAFLARRSVRDRFYNSFLTTHHLFLVFYGLMFYHPLSNIIKHQTNTDKHRIACDLLDNVTLHSNEDLMVLCEEPPKFGVGFKRAWIWPLVGLLVYLVDLSYRHLTSHSDRYRVTMVQSYTMAGRAVHLRLQFLRKSTVKVRPGQYVLLQCPSISALEWHPFTITELPTDTSNNLTLTIKVRGDWTEELYERIGQREHARRNVGEMDPYGRMNFLLDGPYPSVMSSMLDYKRILFIGAGIGITPFVTIMRLLLSSNIEYPVRVHLVWIARSMESFLWFTDEIARLQEKLWRQNKPDRFWVKLYWTQNFDENLLVECFGDMPSIISRMHKGRPNWDDIFIDLVTLYPKKSVSVFSCGPKELTKEIRAKCKEYSKHGCNLNYFHEGFG
ncbi:NADPH oxidase 4-like [Anopheles ziemanni]|uniref:NADPH oxidase 4-like n=1 Tax=Anopheles coustani TaxID=139045 RepID=UPI002657B6C3|nr:NADPH oxidase 4-like [Anopheles coustani]XP_058173439.1 NADPH oxidase 4-like [Anopheles ziemanni]